MKYQPGTFVEWTELFGNGEYRNQMAGTVIKFINGRYWISTEPGGEHRYLCEPVLREVSPLKMLAMQAKPVKEGPDV